MIFQNFLKNKIKLEKTIIVGVPALPHIDERTQDIIIQKLTPQMEKLV